MTSRASEAALPLRKALTLSASTIVSLRKWVLYAVVSNDLAYGSGYSTAERCIPVFCLYKHISAGLDLLCDDI